MDFIFVFPFFACVVFGFKGGSDGVRKVVRKVFFRKVFTAHMSLVLYVRFEQQTIQISEAFHISEK